MPKGKKLKGILHFSGQGRNGPREDGDWRTRLCGRRNKMLQDSPMSYLLSQNASFNLSWDKKNVQNTSTDLSGII